MRKEPIVFIVFAAYLGYASSGMLGGSSREPSDRGNQKEYVNAYLPDVSLALADKARSTVFERDLFAPPSPTSPLPPLPYRPKPR